MQALDLDAVRATQRLSARGFEAFLVGGCVRDLLLGHTPKDYDIATEARPQQVKRTFPRNCRIIGRRFKLAHLHFQGNTKILEVSTFRRTPQTDSDDDLLITRDNEFGNAEEDARRRDFTVNALFLDPTRDSILDYAKGLPDLRARVIRTIGDPRVRFREDPVRILRAAKFAGRLGFHIDPETQAAMTEVAPDLVRAAPPRLFEEILRLLRGGHALDSFQLLRDVGALKSLMPAVAEFLAEAPQAQRVTLWRMLEALDHKVQQGATPAPGVLLGVLFLGPLSAVAEANPDRSRSTVAEEVLGPLSQSLRLPRRDAGCLKRVVGVHPRFLAEGERRYKLQGFVRTPYFREALELFELWCLATGHDMEVFEHWRGLAQRRPGRGAEPDGEESDRGPEEAGTADRDDLDGDDVPEEGGQRRRRRRRRRRGGGESDDQRPADPSGDRDSRDDQEPQVAADAPDDAEAGDHDRAADQAEGEATGTGGRRKRRRRRGRKGGGEAGSAKAGGAEAARQPQHQQRQPQQPKPRQQQQQKSGPRKSAGDDRHKGRRDRTRRGRGGEPRSTGDVDVVPRGRDRRGKVEVIEPPPLDLSAFDVELDPKRAVTFGSILEGQQKKKRRRVPDDRIDDYKPPPPPGGGDAPPPTPADPEEFGDW